MCPRTSARSSGCKSLFPERAGYLDVYDHYGLLRRRSVLAHGVHLTARERAPGHETGAAVSHCPTSNLFLGSGLFHVHDAKDPKRPMYVGLGTDIGAGHELLAAGDDERGLQGGRAEQLPDELDQVVLPGHPRRRRSARPGRQDRLARRSARRPTSSSSTRRRRRCSTTAARAREVDRGADVRAVDHGRRPGGGRHLRRG